MDYNIGKKIDGRYEITELIGVGGMADVYKANDIMEDKVVAVKILKTEFSENEDFLRRFRNESKAIAVLSHPNIVKIFDVGFTEKLQYIVMEYIDGITLKEYMEQQGVLKWKDAVHFTIQILRALQHAHDRGIVHRDIKPQNIMLFPDGTIKVMDFGIARFSREDGKTLSDKTIGSVHYISPEQARGDITDEKSDIYSVGAMLYEMLTGKKPFDADTPVAVALMHMQEVAKNPRDINDSIPEGLEEIVIHAMQKDATKRYQSASEMIKDIETFKANPTVVFGYTNYNAQAEDATIFFNPIAKTTGDGLTDENSDEDGEDGEEDEEETKSSLVVPILTGVTVAVVIVAAIAIAILLMSNFNKPKSQTTMPQLVGMNFDEAVAKYKDLIIIEKDPASDYSKDKAEGVIYEQEKAEGREIKKGDTIKVKVSKGTKMVDVPKVSGITFANAKYQLEQAGFVVVEKPQFDETALVDYVIKTDPVEYSKIPYGSTILVYKCIGSTSNEVNVPDLTGKTADEASKLLTSLGLIPDKQDVDVADNAGKVVSQTPPKNSAVAKGSKVTFMVSTGKVVQNSVDIDLPVTSGTTGKYTITAYDTHGYQLGVANDVNLTGISKTKITVKGSGKQTVRIEIVQTGGKAQTLGSFDVNFDAKTVAQKTYDSNAFAKAAKPADSTSSSDSNNNSNNSNNSNSSSTSSAA